jgi:hypothetical protein
MIANLFYTIPGPKMLWQFGELGYDYPINYCQNGTINNNCRTDPKPIKWDYLQDPARRHLHDILAALFHLRQTQNVFQTTDFLLNVSGTQGRYVRLNSPNLNLFTIANVGTSSLDVPANFQHTGTWYEYYSGATLNVTNVTAPLTLKPGEYHLYLDQFVPLPSGVMVATAEPEGPFNGLSVYPNPTGGLCVIDFNLTEPAAVRIQVLDLTGKQVFVSEKNTLPAGDQHYEIHTEQWQSGVYMAVLRDETGQQVVRKIVKY